MGLPEDRRLRVLCSPPKTATARTGVIQAQTISGHVVAIAQDVLQAVVVSSQLDGALELVGPRCLTDAVG